MRAPDAVRVPSTLPHLGYSFVLGAFAKTPFGEAKPLQPQWRLGVCWTACARVQLAIMHSNVLRGLSIDVPRL